MGDTLSIKGTFQILNVLRCVKTWGESVYWPWLNSRILSPLAADTESPRDQECSLGKSGQQTTQLEDAPGPSGTAAYES